MLFRGPEVVAVLDWEIAQIGQPLLDLGCLCIVSIRRKYEGAPNPGGAIDVSIEELYRLYGADAEEMRWYAAMSLYKYASIFGYNLMLHRRGKRPDPMYEGLTDYHHRHDRRGHPAPRSGGLEMTWDFSTEPEFEAKLEWMRGLHARRGLPARGARRPTRRAPCARSVRCRRRSSGEACGRRTSRPSSAARATGR